VFIELSFNFRRDTLVINKWPVRHSREEWRDAVRLDEEERYYLMPMELQVD